MVWSFSRLSSFDNCPYCFFLNYLLNDPDDYPQEGNYYSDMGRYMHSIFEKVLKGKLKIEDAPEYFLDNYDDAIVNKVSKKTMDKTYEKCANYLSEVSIDDLDKYEIVGVEKKVNTLIDGYRFFGIIDLLLKDKETGDYIIVDHKSSAYPFTLKGKVKKNSQDSFDKYKKQMYLYSYAVNDKYGSYPKYLVWNHFKDNKLAVIPFNEDELNQTLKWFVETIKKIKNEEDFNPKLNYFFCKNICSFRSSCEYVADMDADDWGKNS